MKSKFTYGGKYTKEIVLEVLRLLNTNMQIREITKVTGVPETTISNWKFGYTKIYGKHNKLSDELKKEALELLQKDFSMPEIAKKLKVEYNKLRIFLKSELPRREYKCIKVSNGELRDKAKILTPELSYIFGVMYGDGHFGLDQIRLGTKDKDFMDYFVDNIKKWCGKHPSTVEFTKNSKPYYECYLSFKAASDFIKKIIGNRDRVPKMIVDSSNEEILRKFTLGFSDSEGTIVTNKRSVSNQLKLYNQNKVVLNQIKRMLIEVGFDGNKIGFGVNNVAPNGLVYALRINYKDQLKLFNEKIGFTIRRKQQKLENCLKK